MTMPSWLQASMSSSGSRMGSLSRDRHDSQCSSSNATGNGVLPITTRRHVHSQSKSNSPSMPKRAAGQRSPPPKWIKPQLTRLVEEAPTGNDWLHEIKYDGYRMHARIDDGRAQLLTRTGLDWSKRYRFTIDALRSLPVKSAYIDRELCAVRPDGVPAFSRLQAAMDEGRTD